MAKQTFFVDNELERQRMYEATDKDCLVTVEPLNTMTQKQRGALHVWCQELATVLNEAGRPLKMRSVIDPDVEKEYDWNLKLVKDLIYKPVLEAITGKKSTEDQDTADPSTVALHIIRHFCELGLNPPAWPSVRRPR